MRSFWFSIPKWLTLHLRQGVLCWWHIWIEVMIEKKPGDYWVKFVNDFLLDAKFNSILKWLGWQIILHAEQLNSLAPEQYGSSHGLAVIQHSLNYQIILDVIWQLHIPAMICSNNAKACYNCIVHAFASLVLQHLGIPLGPIQVMFGTIPMLNHSYALLLAIQIISFQAQWMAFQFKEWDKEMVPVSRYGPLALHSSIW